MLRMKLPVYLIIFFLIFNINNKAVALTGIGPIKFNNQTMDSFFAYLRGDGNPSGDVGKRQAIKFCSKSRGNYFVLFLLSYEIW